MNKSNFKMSSTKQVKEFTTMVSDSFDRTDEKNRYEIAFRRWLVMEIEEKRLTIGDAMERFNFSPKSGATLINNWRLKYAPEMVLSLPSMNEAEKQKLSALQQKTKELEKQLEDAKMRNIALNLLIDVAEEKLKISIRKKPGAN